MMQPGKQAATPSERLHAVFMGALIALEGGCPPDPRQQLCRYQEDFDEDACRRCWLRYYFDAVNGQSGYFARDADAIFGR